MHAILGSSTPQESDNESIPAITLQIKRVIDDYYYRIEWKEGNTLKKSYFRQPATIIIDVPTGQPMYAIVERAIDKKTGEAYFRSAKIHVRDISDVIIVKDDD
jgi:hypothetical protein